MELIPKRKVIRLKEFDYSSAGAYFITICTTNREPVFWCRGDLRSPANTVDDNIIAGGYKPPLLSNVGIIVDNELQKLSTIYPSVSVDKYCIMPDHIHMILRIKDDSGGRPQAAPTVSRVINQFKRSISKQVGRSVWQKSFYEHGIRNQQDYDEIWSYIENNPLKYSLKQES